MSALDTFFIEHFFIDKLDAHALFSCFGKDFGKRALRVLSKEYKPSNARVRWRRSVYAFRKAKSRCGSRLSHGHSGVVADEIKITYKSFEPRGIVVFRNGCVFTARVCDGIEDVHNLGSIIRVAECAGANGVIIPANKLPEQGRPVRRRAEKSGRLSP